MYSWNSKLNFGKYKGLPIREINKIDPDYLVWVHENVDRIKFSEEIVSELNLESKFIVCVDAIQCGKMKMVDRCRFIRNNPLVESRGSIWGEDKCLIKYITN